MRPYYVSLLCPFFLPSIFFPVKIKDVMEGGNSRAKYWNPGSVKKEGKWVELGIFAPPEMVEAVCDYLMENGSTGVLVEDSTVDSWNYPDKKYLNWTLIKAYFKENDIEYVESSLDGYFKKLQSIFPDSEPPIIRKSTLDRDDWSYSWKRYFEPLRVFEGLIIRPSWLSVEKSKNEVDVVIDPGMAFGTGLHPTTRLALKGMKISLDELDDDKVVRRKLLDVGTGSGVIAISGVKIGFSEAMGIDIDPVAVEVAKKNIEINRCADRAFVLKREVKDIEEKYECVVANIDTPTFLSIRKELSRVVKKGGFLVLSGIRWNESADTKSSFVTQRLELFHVEYEQGWSLMIFRKR